LYASAIVIGMVKSSRMRMGGERSTTGGEEECIYINGEKIRGKETTRKKKT
jgi:hypothetical protein